MYHVYILRSKKNKRKIYIGITTNLTRHLIEHNLSNEIHTKRYAPWRVEAYVALDDKEKAVKFEKYLKSGSGNAFLKKRLLN